MAKVKELHTEIVDNIISEHYKTVMEACELIKSSASKAKIKLRAIGGDEVIIDDVTTIIFTDEILPTFTNEEA